LELEPALFRPIDAAAKKPRTTHPTQFESNGVAADSTALDSGSQMAQSFRPPETVDDVSFRSAMQSHWHADDSR
jgi:hypothetical protein